MAFTFTSSVQFSLSVVFNSLQPHGLQHARPPCPSPTPGAYSNSHPLSWWCHPTISSSVVPFSSCLQSFPASGSFPMSQLFESGGQIIGASASASALPKRIQGWFPLRLTGLISLLSNKGGRELKNWCFWTVVLKTLENPLEGTSRLNDLWSFMRSQLFSEFITCHFKLIPSPIMHVIFKVIGLQFRINRLMLDFYNWVMTQSY